MLKSTDSMQLTSHQRSQLAHIHSLVRRLQHESNRLDISDDLFRVNRRHEQRVMENEVDPVLDPNIHDTDNDASAGPGSDDQSPETTMKTKHKKNKLLRKEKSQKKKRKRKSIRLHYRNVRRNALLDQLAQLRSIRERLDHAAAPVERALFPRKHEDRPRVDECNIESSGCPTNHQGTESSGIVMTPKDATYQIEGDRIEDLLRLYSLTEAVAGGYTLSSYDQYVRIQRKHQQRENERRRNAMQVILAFRQRMAKSSRMAIDLASLPASEQQKMFENSTVSAVFQQQKQPPVPLHSHAKAFT